MGHEFTPGCTSGNRKVANDLWHHAILGARHWQRYECANSEYFIGQSRFVRVKEMIANPVRKFTFEAVLYSCVCDANFFTFTLVFEGWFQESDIFALFNQGNISTET